MNLLDEGRVVSGTSGAMSDREEIVWECSQTAPQPLTTHSKRPTERGDARAQMDALKMVGEHRLTLTNRDSKFVQVGRNDMKTLHHIGRGCRCGNIRRDWIRLGCLGPCDHERIAP